MIDFYDPDNEKHKVYNGETLRKPWDDVSYTNGLPQNFKSSNTKEKIEAILKAKASQFAFPENDRASYSGALAGEEILIVLKGLHQYQNDQAHLTLAWGTYLYHFNVRINGTGNLSVISATQGNKAVSSEATGWQVVKH